MPYATDFSVSCVHFDITLCKFMKFHFFLLPPPPIVLFNTSHLELGFTKNFPVKIISYKKNTNILSENLGGAAAYIKFYSPRPTKIHTDSGTI